MELSPDRSANAYLKSGLQDLQSGARQQAVDKFTKAIQLDSSFALAYDARATALCQMKDYAGAIADCDKAIGLTAHDEHVYVIKGGCSFYLQDIQGALKSLNQAVEMDSDDPLARGIRGLALARGREWESAMADFNKAVDVDPDNALAYYGRAIVDFSLKDYDKSLANVSRAIKLDGTLPDAYGLRAAVNTHLKDRAGAFADANAGIQFASTNGTSASRYRSYLDRANVETTWDDFSGASNDIETAVMMNPNSPDIDLCRGALEQKCGNFEGALADFSRGLLRETGNVDIDVVYESMGYDQAELGQWQPALESFRKAMTLQPPPDDAAFQVFLIERRLGQTRQAKEELAAYIKSIPAAKAGDWTTSIAHFLAGTLNESDFIAQATTNAKRPTDVPTQTGDAWYYAGMQHLLAGDKPGALKRFKKCLKFGDDNSDNYMMAKSLLVKH